MQNQEKAIAQTVLDEESGHLIPITDELQAGFKILVSGEIYEQVKRTIRIAIFCNGKYYLAGGCSTQDEGLEKYFGLGRTQGLKLKKIGMELIEEFGIDEQKFLYGNQQLLLPNSKSSPGEPVEEKQDVMLQGFEEVAGVIGINRVAALLDHGITPTEIANKQVIELRDGSKVSLQKLIDEKSDEKISILDKNARKKYSSFKERVVNLEEKLKKALEENKIYLAKLDGKENIKELETIYGGKAKYVRDKFDAITSAEKFWHNTMECLENADIQEDDPDTLRKRMYDVSVFIENSITYFNDRRWHKWVDLEDIATSTPKSMKKPGKKPEWAEKYLQKQLAKNPNYFADYEKLNNGKLHPSDPRRQNGEGKAPAEPEPAAEQDNKEPERIIRKDHTRMAIKVKSNGERTHGWKNLESGFNSEQDLDKRFDELLQEPGTSDG